MQQDIAGLALDVLEHAVVARTTVQAPVVWDEADDDWRLRFMHVGDDNRAQLAAAGAERQRLQEEIRLAKSDGPPAADDAKQAG